MHGMVEAGVDIIELGRALLRTPWPMAMAPSSKGGREGHCQRRESPAKVKLWTTCASSARKTSTPPLVGWATPTPSSATTCSMARAPLCAMPQPVSLDGMLVVDYPPEQCQAFAAALKAHGMDHDLPAGTHQQRRMASRKWPVASGHVYYVSPQRRDRLGRAGYRLSNACWPASSTSTSRWAWVLHPRWPNAQAVANGRCRHHWQPHHPADWKTRNTPRSSPGDHGFRAASAKRWTHKEPP